MFCSRCGKQVPEEATFCPACGFKLSSVWIINEDSVADRGQKSRYYDISKQVAVDASLKIGQNLVLDVINRVPD